MTQSNLFDFVKDTSKYQIHKFTPYQFRINDRIDIYPTSQRYHIIRGSRKGERGSYTELEPFLEEFLHTFYDPYQSERED